MAAKILRYGCVLALLLAPASAYALAGDPAAFRSGIGAAGDDLSPNAVRYTRYAHHWRGRILPVDYQQHCGWGMRWQPFPSDHGYVYACVPWR